MESAPHLIFFVAVVFLQSTPNALSAVIPTTSCINPSAVSILQNPCDDHSDKVIPTSENRSLLHISKHAGDLRVHIKSVLDVVKKERYHSPNPDVDILLPKPVQDVSISRNSTQIKHTLESMFLYVEQFILTEQKRQLLSEIPDKLCIINRAIVKILCYLYRMGETNQSELLERSKAIKSSVQVSPPNYHFTFKELFNRFHGFLCGIMKHNGGETNSVCSKEHPKKN